MRVFKISLIIGLVTLAATLPTVAQQRKAAVRHQTKTPAAEHESNFYIKGPNAPFKNQQRKFTDPLNANGGR